MWKLNQPANRRSRTSLGVEELEDRIVPSGNPFNSPVFQQEIQDLMTSNNLPQISFAVEQGGQTFTYGYSNPLFFGNPDPPVTSADSLFRLASVSKVFAAAAIMRLVQDGKLQLTDDPFQILGYFNANGTAKLLNGFDPLDGKTPVSVTPAATGANALSQISIQELLNMSSGLPLSVPAGSVTLAAGTITGATNASPIVITSPNNGLTDGEIVTISGVQGNTAANGTWKVHVIDNNTFSLKTLSGSDSSGNGTFTSSSNATWDLWDSPIYVNGSYAALAFAGAFQPTIVSYTGAPASVYQQLNYYVYSYTNYGVPLLNAPGTAYVYNDVGYAVLGAVADTLAEKDYGMDYGQYLQTYILGPMGISPPMANPPPSTPMAGIGRTLAANAYPTEVSYFANASEPPATSIFPNPLATAPPFYDPNPAPQPYGGSYYVESHFAEGGMVANPLALVTFFNNLYAAYNGATTGPLTPATVQEMVSEANGTLMNGSSGPWWGLGWEVQPAPGTTDVPGEWDKNGGLPGTSSLVVKLDNGATFAYVINENDGDAVGVSPDPSFAAALKVDVKAALSASANWSGFQSLSGYVTQITSARDLNGDVELFGIGSDQALWVNSETSPGGPFGGWNSLGGYVKQIVVGTNQDGTLAVFVIGSDNAAYAIFQQQSGGSLFFTPGAYTRLGGIVQQLAVAIDATGDLELFGIGNDNALYVNVENGKDSDTFLGWNTDLGGYVKQIVVGTNEDGRLQVFGIGSDNAAWTIAQSSPGTLGFGDWPPLGGVVKQLAVGLDAKGVLELFAIGSDNAVYLDKQMTANGPFGGWNTDLDLYVFGIGSDGAAWYRGQNSPSNPTFASWTSLGGIVKQLSAASEQNGDQALFAIGSDNAGYLNRQGVS